MEFTFWVFTLASLRRECSGVSIRPYDSWLIRYDDVRITYLGDGRYIRIAGFDQGALGSDHNAQGLWDGFGLLGMRERISALGGTLKLWNDGGRSTLEICATGILFITKRIYTCSL